MSGRRQERGLRDYLKKTWEEAFNNALDFDFSKEPYSVLRTEHLLALLYNYRKYIRRNKLKNADEWQRLENTTIHRIDSSRFVIQKKIIFRNPGLAQRTVLKQETFSARKISITTEIPDEAAHLP